MPLVAEAFCNYPTYNFILRGRTVAFRRWFLAAMYRELVFSSNSPVDGRVWLIAIETTTGRIAGGLYLSSHGDSDESLKLRSPGAVVLQTTHQRDCPGAVVLQTTYQRDWARSWFNTVLLNLRSSAFTLALTLACGPLALRRLLRYSARGKLLSRAFAIQLAAGTSAVATGAAKVISGQQVASFGSGFSGSSVGGSSLSPGWHWRIDHIFVTPAHQGAM